MVAVAKLGKIPAQALELVPQRAFFGEVHGSKHGFALMANMVRENGQDRRRFSFSRAKSCRPEGRLS
jgi:hypothetical protein